MSLFTAKYTDRVLASSPELEFWCLRSTESGEAGGEWGREFSLPPPWENAGPLPRRPTSASN